jgi:hypothetical protein
MPEYDAVFITPDGRILYSNGLQPPQLKQAAKKDPGADTQSVPQGRR